MTMITFAIVIAFLSLGQPSTTHAQLGGLRRKAADALKDAAKKDTAKTAKPDTAKKAPSATTPATTAATTPASTPAAQSPAAPRGDAKVWENYDFVPGRSRNRRVEIVKQ